MCVIVQGHLARMVLYVSFHQLDEVLRLQSDHLDSEKQSCFKLINLVAKTGTVTFAALNPLVHIKFA